MDAVDICCNGCPRGEFDNYHTFFRVWLHYTFNTFYIDMALDTAFKKRFCGLTKIFQSAPTILVSLDTIAKGHFIFDNLFAN